MSDDFKISDLGAPLYEWSQVITVSELVNTVAYLTLARKEVPWWRFMAHHDLKLAVRLISEMIVVLQNGKKNQGETR